MTAFFNLPLNQQLQIMKTAARHAMPLWGLSDAKLTLIKHRENAVFKAIDNDGAEYAVRVHRLGYHSNEELNSELLWMDALRAAGIETPRIIKSVDQSLLQLIHSEGSDQPFQVDIQEWFEGTPLGEVKLGDESAINSIALADHYCQIGQMAARTHNQACSWKVPENFVRHAWDLDGLTGEEPFWGRFWDIEGASPEQRQLLLQCRDKLRQELSEFGTGSDRYSLIHADFLPENILVNREGIRLIDFDDAGYGWHLFDLATPLITLIGTPAFDEASNAMIRGYRQERALPEDHLAMLPSFIVARWTTYFGWVHTRSETEVAQTMRPQLLSTIDTVTSHYLA
ncbi:aminoglycoside phosphotransferase [Motiliproteus coralliicola]|uniref:Aminoglycoside phosphotransferase n=1 Tax=Motiliproteus coralliicola TaxID=2283196 RepID=A0A369WVT4_9GAMM|nr:phosphotransferase [Motiliproteus coralliicola]RDE24656.1 aminoglycoside phosphotransferase [Motiliproteus coralliicola]